MVQPPDDPFDIETGPPIYRRPWWIAIAIILIVALVLSLASPLFSWL